jgi:hypothetical protein
MNLNLIQAKMPHFVIIGHVGRVGCMKMLLCELIKAGLQTPRSFVACSELLLLVFASALI